MPEAAGQLPPDSRQIAVLCNPKSGNLRGKLDSVRTLEHRLPGGAYLEASSPSEIAAALHEISHTGCDLLGIVGGDGTIQAALTALHSLRPTGPWPTLTIVPAGSTNMTARDLGPLPTLERGLQLLGGVDASNPACGTRVTRPMLCVQRQGLDALCGMFFGAAVISDGVRFFQERLRRLPIPGERTSLLSILRVLVSLRNRRKATDSADCAIGVSVDGGKETTHLAMLCLVSTLHRLLLGTRPYWGDESGPLHFTLVEAAASGFWRDLWRFARGRPGTRLIPERGYISHNAHAVSLSLDGPFVLDGELFDANVARGPLLLSTPRAVEWFVP